MSLKNFVNKSKLAQLITFACVLLITVILASKYFSPKTGYLPSEKIWAQDELIISDQRFSPLDSYKQIVIEPPQIVLTNQNEYKGFDGCNAFSGKFFYLENGYAKFYKPTNTLMGCRNSGPGMAEISFLESLQRVHQYEAGEGELIFTYYFSGKKVAMKFHPTSNPHKYIGVGKIPPECHFLLMVTLRDLCFFDKERY